MKGWKAFVLAAGLIAIGTMPGRVLAQDAQDTGADYGSTVTDFRIGDSRVLVYYPSPNAADVSGVHTSCTAPVFIVYPDSALTDDGVIAFAEESGLAEIASQNGSSVCFVEPANGEIWTEEDNATYQALVQSVSDSSQVNAINGVGYEVDFVSGAAGSNKVLLGTSQRVYVYADGAGADFVADTLLRPMKVMSPWGFETDATIAGCVLKNVSDVSGVEDNDIPVVYIGEDEEIINTLNEKCGEVLVDTAADFVSQYETLIGRHRREDSILLDVNNYEEEGIIEKIRTFSLPTTDAAAESDAQGEKELTCFLYYGADLDIENGNVPLVLGFHGHGNTAMYLAQSSDWPEIGLENGFMTVLVDDHEKYSASDIVALLDILEEEYSIDESRVYATGFSIGSVKTFDLMEQYPERFAAFAPMNGYFATQTEIPEGVIVPTFYVGAQNSPLTELPSQSEVILERLKTVSRANDTTKQLDVSMDDMENWENQFWGENGELAYQVNDEKEFINSILTVNLFRSNDGHYYTAYCDSSNQGHQMFSRNCYAAWDFMSQFSRAEDGSVVIEETAYSLPSADGSVVDNSYNMAE